MSTTTQTLDDAYAEAEAALPEGWDIDRIIHLWTGGYGPGIPPLAYDRWRVTTTMPSVDGPWRDEGPEADGATPADALYALAELLRTVPR